MKRLFLFISMAVLITWEPQFNSTAQVSKPVNKVNLDEKNAEKLQLFERVNLIQDSILNLLNKKPSAKRIAVKYIKIYKPIQVAVPDTLKVDAGNKFTEDAPDSLPNNYYLVRDSGVVKKKTFFQRIFHRR